MDAPSNTDKFGGQFVHEISPVVQLEYYVLDLSYPQPQM